MFVVLLLACFSKSYTDIQDMGTGTDTVWRETLALQKFGKIDD